MAYIAVDENGNESIYSHKPVRIISNSASLIYNQWCRRYNEGSTHVNVPKGTALRLSGQQMTWSDEPFKLVQI